MSTNFFELHIPSLALLIHYYQYTHSTFQIFEPNMNSILSICSYPNLILHEAQSLMCNLSPEQAFAILFVSSIVSSFVSLFFLMACTEFFTRKVPDENICYEKFLVTRINRKEVHSEVANCAICLGNFGT